MKFNSIGQLEEALKDYGIDQPIMQLSPGKFQASLASNMVGDTSFFSDRYSVGVALQLEPPSNTVGILWLIKPYCSAEY